MDEKRATDDDKDKDDPGLPHQNPSTLNNPPIRSVVMRAQGRETETERQIRLETLVAYIKKTRNHRKQNELL